MYCQGALGEEELYASKPLIPSGIVKKISLNLHWNNYNIVCQLALLNTISDLIGPTGILLGRQRSSVNLSIKLLEIEKQEKVFNGFSMHIEMSVTVWHHETKPNNSTTERHNNQHINVKNCNRWADLDLSIEKSSRKYTYIVLTPLNPTFIQ